MNEQTLLTRSELASEICRRTGVTSEDATKVIEVLGEIVADAVASDRTVLLPKLGKISKRTRTAQRGVNFHTGEPMVVDSMEIPKIRWSKLLKKTVRG
ncbi:MAG: HU family DNA-binding protein [Rhodobacteraceae bacterium]|nr:HU family DNA-binding protein [Paracoccaceae bacterium]